MRATRHNGRKGKHGIYNPNYNDRRFNLENSDHIDPERTPFNIYCDCIQGITTHDQRADPEKGILTFDDVEDIFYAQRFFDRMYCLSKTKDIIRKASLCEQ